MTDVIVQGKDVIVEVQQPTVPPAAPPPKIGLVEISQVVARGTAWMTGNGPPTAAGGQYGDMYLDATTGDMYQWDGTAWQYIGTFAPSTDTPAEVLAKIVTVDGAGSGLDADLLDGHDSPYFATQAALTTEKNRNDTQDTEISTNATNINSNISAIADLQNATTPANLLTSIKTVDGSGSGLDADTLDGHDTAYFGTAAADTAEATARANADTTLQNNINLKANIASPVFTGDPQAPTPATADNDTSIATTAYVKANVATIVSFPEAPSDGNQYARLNASWAKVVAGGGGGATGASEYTFNTTTTTPPASGQVRFNNATQSLATKVWIAYLTAPGNDAKQLLLYSYKQGKDLYIQDKDDSSKWIVFTLTSNATDLTTYAEWSITHKANSGVPLTAQRVMLSAISASAAAGTARRTNLVINGALNVSQENGNTEGTTTGYYAADQMPVILSASPAAFGFSRIISANVSGSQYRLQFRVTTAKASLAAADVANIQTRIEGFNMQDLAWVQPAFGTPAPKDALLAFNFNGPAGTYAITIRNNALTYTFAATFTITAGQAGVDTAQVIKIPAPPFSMGPWLIDNGVGITITFALAAGSTGLAPTTGWQAGNFTGVTGMSNGLAAVQSFQLWDIYFGADPDKTGVPPLFEVPDYMTELVKCKRYWQQLYIMFSGNTTSGSAYYAPAAWSINPRVAPSLSGANAGSSSFPATVGTLVVQNSGLYELRVSNTSGPAFFQTLATLNARL
jgi:hypothetical protein